MSIRNHIRSFAAGLAVVGACAFLLVRGYAATNYPSWWTSVIDTNAVANDFAPVAAGQLKWIAAKAYDELETNFPGGAGTGVAAVVQAFSLTNNYVPVNLGQLKFVAKPFYDRLIAGSYTSTYPWTEATDDDADFAPAILGQVKKVFSFDLDADADGLPDWWEVQHFGSVSSQTGSGDADADGMLNVEEFAAGADPNDLDSDNDGVLDGYDPSVLVDGSSLIFTIIYPTNGAVIP